MIENVLARARRSAGALVVVLGVCAAATVLVAPAGPAGAEPAPWPPKVDMWAYNDQLELPPTAIGDTSTVEAFIFDTGTAAATGLTASAPASSPFSIVNDPNSPHCDGRPKLQMRASCVVKIAFAPTAPGTATADVTVAWAGGSTAVHVHGTTKTDAHPAAGPFLFATDTQIRFLPTKPGSSPTVRSLTLENLGSTTTDPITITDPGAPYTMQAYGCGALAPGATCSVNFSFAATNGQPPINTSTITAGDQTITVTVEGFGPLPVPTGGDDAYRVTRDQVLHVDVAHSVLLNDTGRGLYALPWDQTMPEHGSLDLQTDGSFSYTPAPGFEGTDTFSYIPTDVVSQVGLIASGDRIPMVTITVRSPDHAFVEAAYDDFLHRAPTPTEEDDLTAALTAHATTRPAFLHRLAGSDEWIGAVVDQLYQDTLGRHGDPSGTAHWVEQIQGGRRSVAQVAAAFYASDEYFRGAGGGTTGGWVTDLYGKLLGRAPDAAGKAYWVSQTAQHGRTSVALRLYQSPESRRARVTRLYEDLLGRTPDPAGRVYWADQILTKGDLALAVDLASSSEYMRHAQVRFP